MTWIDLLYFPGISTHMEADTLLPIEGQTSGEVALTKGWQCGASMAAEVGAFSGIGERGSNWLSLIRPGSETSLKLHEVGSE